MGRNPHDHLAGLAPRTRGRQNRIDVASFIYRFGYSTSDVLKSVIAVQTDTWFRAAKKRGDFRGVKTPVGELLVLTECTLALAECHAGRLTPYPELEPERINTATVRHNLFVQRITQRAMALGSVESFLTEREIATADVRNVKRPDVVWHAKNGARCAVEVELTAKWARHFDDFAVGVVKALDSTNGEPVYDQFLVVTDSKAIATRYREDLQPGKPLRLWAKDARGKWSITKTGKIPDWLPERIGFKVVEVTS